MRAATRVNAEQASKRATRRPTRLNNGEGCHRSRSERHAHRPAPPGNGGGTHGRGGWLQHGKPRRWRGTRQPTTREGRVGLFGVAERPVLLTRPGNAGGGKGPQVRSDDRRAAGLGSGDAYNPELRPGSPEASHAQAKEPSRTKGASHARNARGCRGVNRLDDPPEAMGKGGREPCRPRSQHRE